MKILDCVGCEPGSVVVDTLYHENFCHFVSCMDCGKEVSVDFFLKGTCSKDSPHSEEATKKQLIERWNKGMKNE